MRMQQEANFNTNLDPFLRGCATLPGQAVELLELAGYKEARLPRLRVSGQGTSVARLRIALLRDAVLLHAVDQRLATEA